MKPGSGQDQLPEADGGRPIANATRTPTSPPPHQLSDPELAGFSGGYVSHSAASAEHQGTSHPVAIREQGKLLITMNRAMLGSLAEGTHRHSSVTNSTMLMSRRVCEYCVAEYGRTAHGQCRRFFDTSSSRWYLSRELSPYLDHDGACVLADFQALPTPAPTAL